MRKSAVLAPVMIVLTSAWVWGVVSAHPRVSTALTWRADIKPLFDRQCVSCHAPGNAANTVPLATYDQVRPWIAAIREEVLERRMPLPRGRPGIDPGVDDHPLSPMERDVIVGWIDGGAPEGRVAAGAADAAGAETEAPAATFWCRMHPEIRADRAGACPLCGMELAAFTPDLARALWMVGPCEQASAHPPGRGCGHGRGRSRLRASARISAAPVRGERRLQRLSARASGDGRARPGRMDGAVARGEARTLLGLRRFPSGWRRAADAAADDHRRRLTTTRRRANNGASNGARDTAKPSLNATPSVIAALSTSTLSTSTPTLRTGDEARITIALTDAKSGAPVDDLQPYLGAWGHLFVLHEGRDEALHAHPDSTATTPGGPAIAFDVMFPRPRHLSPVDAGAAPGRDRHASVRRARLTSCLTQPRRCSPARQPQPTGSASSHPSPAPS